MIDIPQLDMPATSKPAIESTLPLINIVFLLLIFFLVGGTFIVPSEKTISPPSTSIDFEGIQFPPSQWVYANSLGELTFEDKSITFANLPKTSTKGRAVLFADGGIRGGDLVQTLNAFEIAGVKSVLLVTERERDK